MLAATSWPARAALLGSPQAGLEQQAAPRAVSAVICFTLIFTVFTGNMHHVQLVFTHHAPCAVPS
jgi:hypothetical protein